jgi:hypothetical protein
LILICFLNEIKIFDFYDDFKNIISIDNKKNVIYLLYNSAILLNNLNKNYIIVSNFNVWESEAIKIFDLKGIKLKEINDNSNDKTFLIDIYHDKKPFKNYIITGNWGYIKSYDYHKDKILYIPKTFKFRC